MEYVAAGSFGIQFGGGFGWYGDSFNPLGVAPLNISNLFPLGNGEWEMQFTVPIEKHGTERYKWYLSVDYGAASVKWLGPKRAIVRLYDPFTGAPSGTTRFAIAIVREIPDGMPADGLIIAQTFNPNGNRITLAEPTLGVTDNIGVASDTTWTGQYIIPFNIDFIPSACAPLVLHQEGLYVATSQVNPNTCRNYQVGFINPGNMAWAQPSNNWTFASFRFNTEDREVPSRLWMLSKYRADSGCPGGTVRDWYNDPHGLDMLAGTYSLSTAPVHYSKLMVDVDVFATFASAWGRTQTECMLGTNSEYYFTSSDENVVAPGTANETASGMLDLVGVGTCTIQAHFRGMVTDPMTITVVP